MDIKIEQLERKSGNGEVVKVYWTATKTDGEYLVSSNGLEMFSPDPSAPDFIPFEELTEADVKGWLLNVPGWVDSLEKELDQKIEGIKNPVSLYGVPWDQSEEQS